MASIGLWCPWSLQRPLSHFTFVSNNNKGTPRIGGQQWAVQCCKNDEPQQCFQNRRQILVGMTMSFAGFSCNPILSNAFAETDVAEGFRIYTDDVNKFKISVPKGWSLAAGEPDGFKSVTAFYPEGNTSSNVSVVITGLGPDFTKIESFGKVDEFAETLVSGLDRSWQRPPGVEAKLINSKSSNGFYYIEYTLQRPGETRRYLFSALGMASNGWINRLYTITGQFEEADLDNYGSQIQQAVKSFRFI
ncbi:psbP domain-containing protein 3, chloroplastic-like [Humulus lupulus]|uniref:psbP domain-containing protein 3, chloroplastic-like n=1 Tax=Humulus lupulus TaxID=3486 RepID=UPI002B40A3AB|nr:psbP domain-containing protein 3, chloroplastic-like [Humulus lupulus]